jgi:cytidine deaminase
MSPDEEIIGLEGSWGARDQAYIPISDFSVGAALATVARVSCGWNVQNLSFGFTVCAKRVAVAAAILVGQRQLTAIAIVGGTEGPVVPCETPRQILAEFVFGSRTQSEELRGKRREPVLSEPLRCSITRKLER